MKREEAIKILSSRDNNGLPNITWVNGFAEAYDMAIRSLEAWESVIEEINEVDFYFLIAESGSCASEVLKTSLLNTIKKALKEVEK